MSTLRIRIEQPDCPASTRRAPARDRGAEATAIIVLVMTFACAALALFDLYLLATGL